MRIFIAVLVLIFSLQSWTKADDIRDFQIEGMSVGDSLLDYYSVEEIKSKKKPLSIGGKKFYQWRKVGRINNKTYEVVWLYFIADDEKYIIRTISGRNHYPNNINECYDLQSDIVNQIEILMDNVKKIGPIKAKNGNFPNGNSYKKEIGFIFEDKSFIRIVCYDYSKKDTNTRDRLSVQISTQQYNNWLKSKDKK